MLNKLFRKSNKVTAHNFTQGQDKSFTYEAGKSMTILKYRFDDCYHANIKVIPIVMVDGKAYINEAVCLYEGTVQHDNSVSPKAARSFIMSFIHSVGDQFYAHFTDVSQYYSREQAAGPAKVSEYDEGICATFDHRDEFIYMTVDNTSYVWTAIDPRNMEESGFRKLDMNRA